MKLGIIGLGNVYTKQIEAIKNFSDIEITGICDKNIQKLEDAKLNVFKTTNC